MQKIKFFGVPLNILNWDQSSYPEYTERVKVFSQFFQLESFDLHEVRISIQGFHYLNKQQNTRDSIISIIPLGFLKSVKPKRKVKLNK